MADALDCSLFTAGRRPGKFNAPAPAAPVLGGNAAGSVFPRATRPQSNERMAAMPQGTIKRLVADRGFGFISADGRDVFFHLSSLQDVQFDDLQEGQSVEYELQDDDGGKGPRAATVRLTN